MLARSTVARLVRTMGLKGITRGKAIRTRITDPTAACPLNRVNRQFDAPRPNAPQVADLTYVAGWSGFITAAFVIDVLPRRIIGWHVSRSARTDLVLYALEQAPHQRQTFFGSGLVCHSDRGSQ